ncbi:MAG: hypothetical protein M0C28_48530 [Candidatus Moduliflexus flocculans]|nr:hypothetical protein [Candidatus Moduliflexus flocculans]
MTQVEAVFLPSFEPHAVDLRRPVAAADGPDARGHYLGARAFLAAPDTDDPGLRPGGRALHRHLRLHGLGTPVLLRVPAMPAFDMSGLPDAMTRPLQPLPPVRGGPGRGPGGLRLARRAGREPHGGPRRGRPLVYNPRIWPSPWGGPGTSGQGST